LLRSAGFDVFFVEQFCDCFHSFGGQGLLLQSHMKSVMVSVSLILLINTPWNSEEKSALSVLGLFGGDFGERQGELRCETRADVSGDTLAEDLQLVSLWASFNILM